MEEKASILEISTTNMTTSQLPVQPILIKL